MEISLGAQRSDRSFSYDSLLGLAVATTHVEHTMRAEAGFSRYLSFRLFQQYPREGDVSNRREAAIAELWTSTLRRSLGKCSSTNKLRVLLFATHGFLGVLIVALGRRKQRVFYK
jgi:hypothetical protein